MKFNFISPLLILLSIIFPPKSNSDFFKKNANNKAFMELIDKKYVIPSGDGLILEMDLIFKSDKCIEILDILFKAGISANEKLFYNEHDFYSLLSQAIHDRNIPLASLLIENGADVNAIDSSGFSSLVYAVISKFKEGVELLVKHGALINEKYNERMSVLNFALAEDDTEIIELLIQKGAKLDEVDAHGNTALFSAVAAKNDSAIKILIKYGLDISKEIGILKGAISQPDKSMVELLINNGVGINEKDTDGNTPLAIAISLLETKWFGNYEKSKDESIKELKDIIEFLLENGANPNVMFYEPIALRSLNFNYGVAETFEPGAIPLIQKAWQLNKEIYGLLLKFGAKEDEEFLHLKNFLSIFRL